MEQKAVVPDHHWEALFQVAKGNREQAVALVEEKSSPVPFEWKASRPGNIDSFFDKLLVDFLADKPQNLNGLGLLESIGVHDHNRFLNNCSVEGKREAIENAKRNLKILLGYDYDSLAPDQQVSYNIFLWWLGMEVEGETFLFHEYPVNQMFGVLSGLTETFTQYHKLEKLEDFTLYQKRLSSIWTQFSQIKHYMREQQSRGITLPKFAFERVVSSISTLIEAPHDENPFILYVQENLQKLPGDNEVLMHETHRIITTDVIAAYVDFRDFLLDLSKNVETDHSVLGLPKGEQYYAHCLKQQTTTNLTPDEVYELGLKEVAGIQAEMRQLLESVGVKDESKTVGELMSGLSEDESHFYPNTAEGKEDCIRGFQQILERSREELWQYFDLKPELPVKIVPVPKHEEEGMPGAYYYVPSLDGSRPGTFYVNLRDTKELPKFGMETLLVHEAEPGHHFQLTLQSQSKIPVLRKMGEFNAYIEGWALYTEKLAYEKGFYTTAYDKLGHLQDELLRAVRLVVDPAIHAKGWSREEAIDYMQQQTGFNREVVVTEVERYFVMPGQACSYKIGQIKILELREKAMRKMGDRFDIRQFHNVVLGVGACPLGVLDQVVEKYINS